MQPFESTTGTVTSFSEKRGYGTVKDETGSELPFHCASILDGSRTIGVGQAVEFQVVPGRGGRWEAKDLRPVGPWAQPPP